MTKDEVVKVPRWALEFALQRGCFQDEGPSPEGWASDEMKRALEALESALNGTGELKK